MTEVPIYRNQSIDLQSKPMDWLLYDRDLRHESVKGSSIYYVRKAFWSTNIS